MRTASIRPLPVMAFALALACVAMVPAAHAGVRVWTDDSWEIHHASISQHAGDEYCRDLVSAYDEYRPRVVVRYVIIHPQELKKISIVSRRYVIHRVEQGELNLGARRTVVPAPARVYSSQRSRVVSTSRLVNQVKRASFEAKQSSRVVSSKRAQKVSAKQQDDPVKVASKSTK